MTAPDSALCDAYSPDAARDYLRELRSQADAHHAQAVRFAGRATDARREGDLRAFADWSLAACACERAARATDAEIDRQLFPPEYGGGD